VQVERRQSPVAREELQQRTALAVQVELSRLLLALVVLPSVVQLALVVRSVSPQALQVRHQGLARAQPVAL